MDLITGLPVWAQAQSGAPTSNTIPLLALRRWCGSQTLSSPRAVPDWHGLWGLLAALALLLLMILVAQGPVRAVRQLLDFPGHLRLAAQTIRRIRRTPGTAACLIGFTVLSWTGAESLVLYRESGRSDLVALTRSRRIGELAMEQGVLAALTPLRDVAALADNLPLLIVAVIAMFRASIEPQGEKEPGAAAGRSLDRARPGWGLTAWGAGALYILYRIVSRAAGSPDLPTGNCLVIETIVIPVIMVMVDGLLLGWLLAALRNAGLDAVEGGRLGPMQAVVLMPASALACLVSLPSRYVAAFVVLANDHLPTSVAATPLGSYIRWQIGDWGLADLQAAALVFVGLAGVVAWTRGRIGDAIAGYGRLLAADGGHLVAALAMAALASLLLSATAYSVLLLLPAQPWVLNAADSYAHFATLPVGLWTLSAVIELARRSLPMATPASSTPRAGEVDGEPGLARPEPQQSRPSIATTAP